mmetsp:Transcript_34825/g.52171  ORF Transcript_34825/g.52171 Transcript_34825/m.52171 type:complete len:381 (+) Transcript_34825:301-1443(+)|eukprot:scaffold24733_cov216-Skeletonema_dohrnii-CCMP3373.AAC.3
MGSMRLLALWLIIGLVWLCATLYLFSLLPAYHVPGQLKREVDALVTSDTKDTTTTALQNIVVGVDRNKEKSTGTAIDSDPVNLVTAGNIFPVEKSEICVRKISAQCELYPCAQQNGVFVETATSNTTLGYAGRFVHRDANVEKQAMGRAGGAQWASGCVISDKYKFAYIHILKSGGSATKKFLRKSLCGEDDVDCKRVDPRVVRPIVCEQIPKKHPDYFTFSFVRNPFSRMYSMYSMMDGFPRQKGGLVTDTVSFSKFVMTEPNKRSAFTKMSSDHYWAQTDFIFSKNSCPSFDFLGRVDQFDQDMRTILEHLNATEMIDYLDSIGGKVTPVNTWGSSKKKSIGGDLRTEYSSPEIRGVVDFYKRDFILLGYDRQDVPST